MTDRGGVGLARLRRLGIEAFEACCGAAKRRWAFFATVVLVVLIQTSGLLQPIDNAFATLRALLIQRAPTQSIVIVTIDPRSLHTAGEWPWPRERFAQAIRNLQGAGAKLIGFDVDFSARSSASGDAALRGAIGAAPGAIVLPTFVQPDGRFQNTPLASLSENAVFAGVNIPIDPDGAVRRYYRGFNHGGGYYPSMASVLAGAPYGSAAPFLIDYGVRAEQIGRLSFEDVYTGAFDPSRVRGRVVLIGATALEFGDFFTTASSPATPGVFIHALAYEGLAQGRALTQLNAVVLFAFGFVTLVFLWPRKRALDVRELVIRHGAIASVAVLGPIAVQAAAPLSIDAGTVFLAQAICLWAAIQQELKRRRTELARQREEHLTFVAHHDPETDLQNRRAMQGEIRALLAASNAVVVVAAVGVDRFFVLRGAIGYARANEVVKKLADAVSAAFECEAAFHLSTSVIGVAFPAPDAASGREACKAALARLEARVRIDDQEIAAPVRVGVATSQDTGEGPDKLLEQATLALDEARARKRPYATFDAATFPDPQLRLHLLSDMSAGLSRGEFYLAYQPKAATRGGALVGAEALMRWRHPKHGLISPERFIAAAEETGAIDGLTRWAVERAIADQARLRAQGLDVEISVNVSGRILSSAVFCDFATETVRRAGARLCFEITETAIIEDPVEALASIDDFRRAGIKISIDDYGVGLSSLSYLKLIEADELKLDKSLITSLTSSKRDRLILKSTIDLAHGLGLSVVAEGVEDEYVIAELATLGCDVVQGFAISSPLALPDFIGFLNARAGCAPPHELPEARFKNDAA